MMDTDGCLPAAIVFGLMCAICGALLLLLFFWLGHHLVIRWL
jgi:hypothetical protein